MTGDDELEHRVPSEGVIDDTNTMEGQLLSGSAQTHVSRHLSLQIEKYLSGITYPAEKSAIYDYAKASGADEKLLDSLRRLPQKSFESADALHHEILSHS